MSIQKVTLTRISRFDKTSKAGKPYTQLGFQCKEYGDRWINGFGNKINATWKEDDVIEVDIFEEAYNGKTYLKFKPVDEIARLKIRVENLERVVGRLQKENPPELTGTNEPLAVDYSADDIDPDEIPF